VRIQLAAITVSSESGVLATLNHNPAVGDRFRIELASGFRLYVNDILRHERTNLGAAVRYPAFYNALLTTPVGVQPVTIPAPKLIGDWQLRLLDLSSNPIVNFQNPSHGSLSAGASALEKQYSGGTLPGQYTLTAFIKTGDDIYMED